MKIAVWHNTGPGGARRYLFDHVKGLLRRGHAVESWCLSTANAQFLPLSSLIPEHVVPVETESSASHFALRHLARRWKESDRLLSAVSVACRQCAEEINQGAFDVLLVANCVLTVVPPVAEWVKIPRVMYLQEPKRIYYEALPDLPWVVKGIWKSKGRLITRTKAWGREILDLRNIRVLAAAEKKHASGFDRLLVNSLFSRESILRAYGLDSKICYMGVDTGCFKPAEAVRWPFVLGAGEFSAHKNIPFVIDSIAAIQKNRPPLVWVANGGSRVFMNELKQYAASIGVEFKPRFGITDEELLGLYQTAAVAVYAPRLEPCGLVPLEANACGLPVVAVAEGGVREIVKDGVSGFLVEQDKQAAAEAVSRLLSNPALAREMGVGARAWIEERWSLKQSVQRLESRLEEVRTSPCA